MTPIGPRSAPMLGWVVQLAAVSTGCEASVLVSDEPSGPTVVAAFGIARGEAQGWLGVSKHWTVTTDARSMQGGAFQPGFAASAPLIRPTEGILASLWVLSRRPRPEGLNAREKQCLDLLTDLAFEPLVIHYANVGGQHSGPSDRVTVLIADDEPAFRRAARAEFQTAGFAVEEAHSGRQVLRSIAEHSPDILVIDLAMPDGEGIETIQALRAGGYTGVIAAISGAFSRQLLHTAEVLGANAALVKPLRKGELSALVAKLLIDRWGNSRKV